MSVLNRKNLSLRSENGEPADIHLDESGNLAIVEDAEAVGQHVSQRLMAHQGEWFLDSQVGVTWLSEVLGFGYDPIIAEALIKTEILETDGITGINSFSVKFDRTLRQLKSYNVTLETDYDEEVQL